MGFPALLMLKSGSIPAFQSLIGIYGFSGIRGIQQLQVFPVSIPDRDLWVFRPAALL